MLTLHTLIYLAGIGQIGLVLGSLAIPRILGWKQQLMQVTPLLRQVFWTYAGYILVTNLCFGLLSFLAPDTLLQGSTLSTVVTGFIAVYWLSRIGIQFLYFDRNSFPKGGIHTLGETVLLALFVFLAAVYSYSFYVNYTM